MTGEQLRELQAFFSSRAAGWEQRFPNDDPRYAAAVRELAPAPGGRALDVGCGTGRALPLLAQAVEATSLVVGLDATPEMLAEARRLGRDRFTLLVLADGETLPFRADVFQAIFAAGFVPHLADPAAGFAELARVTAPAGRLAIFHPISRAALAARHGQTPSEDDVTAPVRLRPLLASAGWRLDSIDDGADRYLALATRV
ncbi:MAG TPA: methyltransferase domain-containing protein [Chloroflexota bacterium]|nr:methyltransferase domain-containing protein [Chloroflexota bacterium]